MNDGSIANHKAYAPPDSTPSSPANHGKAASLMVAAPPLHTTGTRKPHPPHEAKPVAAANHDKAAPLALTTPALPTTDKHKPHAPHDAKPVTPIQSAQAAPGMAAAPVPSAVQSAVVFVKGAAAVGTMCASSHAITYASGKRSGVCIVLRCAVLYPSRTPTSAPHPSLMHLGTWSEKTARQ